MLVAVSEHHQFIVVPFVCAIGARVTPDALENLAGQLVTCAFDVSI